jgi:nitrite reductase (NO-forming)/hydroxylamine reductase
MHLFEPKSACRLLAASALVLSVGLATAEERGEHPGTTEGEMAYKGTPSAVDPATTKDIVTGEGPEMTTDEVATGRKIFFERCAGCHGVLRKGATGKPLTTDKTRQLGTPYLKAFITDGSPAGMPNWGTSGDLTEAEIDLMARYLQHEPPLPPEYGMAEMKETWKDIVPPEQRPTGFSGGEHTTWRKAASDVGCSDIKKFGVCLRLGGLAGVPGNGQNPLG